MGIENKYHNQKEKREIKEELLKKPEKSKTVETMKQNMDNKVDGRSVHNQNVENAQKEYDYRIKQQTLNRGSGGYNHALTINYDKYTNPSNTRLSTGNTIVTSRKLSQVRSISSNMATVAVTGMINQTEIGRGVEYARTTSSVAKLLVETAGALSYNTATMVYRKQLENQLKDEFGVIGKNKVKRAPKLSDVNTILRKNGAPGVRGSGVDLVKACEKNKKKILKAMKQGRIDPAQARKLIKAYDAGILLGKSQAAKSKMGIRGMFRAIPVKMFMMRELSKSEAGQGLQMFSFIGKRAYRLAKLAIRLERNVAHITTILVKKAALRALKIKAAAAKKTLKAAKKALEKAKKIKVINKAQSKYEKVRNRLKEKKKKALEKKLKKKKHSTLLRRFRERLPHPVRYVKGRFNNLLNSFKRSAGKALSKIPGARRGAQVGKVIGKFFNKILGGIGRFIAELVSGLAHIKAVIGAVLGGVLVVAIIIIALMYSASAIYNATATDMLSFAVERLNNDFVKDITRVSELGYDDITIQYLNVRDEKKYKKQKKSNKSKDFKQSSNCAEIISMAHIKFNYDIGSVSKHELQNYIDGLWHGSHEIIVEKQTVSRTEKSKETTETSALVTYTTYYFDDLFNRPDDLVETPLIEYDKDDDDDSGLACTSWDEIYVFLRNKGYSFNAACGVMANLSFETAGGAALNKNYSTKAFKASSIRADNKVKVVDKSGRTIWYYGICAWTSDYGTWSKIKGYIKAGGDETYSVRGQLKAMTKDLKHTVDHGTSSYWDYLNNLCNLSRPSNSSDPYYIYSNTPYDCGLFFADYYERCAERYRKGRGELAKKIAESYEKYKNDWKGLIKENEKIANYAKQFAYKLHYAGDGKTWRGLSLKIKNGGTDCSGFVALIYQACLPKAKKANFIGTASGYYEAFYSKYKVDKKDAKPGDVIVTSSKHHTGIYLGKGKYVNASTCQKKNGGCGHLTKFYGPCKADTVISDVPSDAYYIRIWKHFV